MAATASQLSGAMVALTPPAVGGMASAVTVIARQGGFAVGVAVLGALAPTDVSAASFIWPFGFASAAAVGGVLACLLLPPTAQE